MTTSPLRPIVSASLRLSSATSMGWLRKEDHTSVARAKAGSDLNLCRADLRSAGAPSSGTTPADGKRSSGGRKRDRPPPWVQGGGLLVERQRHQIQVDLGGHALGVLPEHDPHPLESELGQVDPERMRVIVVGGVEREARVPCGERSGIEA